MIILLPFLNTFFLYICLQPKQLLTKVYAYIMENWLIVLPHWMLAVLGLCITCTASWMGIVEIGVWSLIKHSIYSPEKYLLVFSYNATATTIIYKLMAR